MRRFSFFLAQKLGMTVADLLARIPSRELAEWQAYFLLEAEEDAEAVTREDLAARAVAGVKKRRGGKGRKGR